MRRRPSLQRRRHSALVSRSRRLGIYADFLADEGALEACATALTVTRRAELVSSHDSDLPSLLQKANRSRAVMQLLASEEVSAAAFRLHDSCLDLIHMAEEFPTPGKTAVANRTSVYIDNLQSLLGSIRRELD